MTEAEWSSCTDPEPMLQYLRGKVSDRKARLFAVMCCRRIWPLLIDERSRDAVGIAEGFADGLATVQQLTDARWAAWDAHADMDNDYLGGPVITATPKEINAAAAAEYAAQSKFNPYQAARIAAFSTCDRDKERLAVAEIEAAVAPEFAAQAGILREIFGNPFRPYPAPASWPLPVVQLAAAMYDGQECSFALNDALLEADHPELAEHFRQEQWHPKGCWVIDLLTGRK